MVISILEGSQKENNNLVFSAQFGYFTINEKYKIKIFKKSVHSMGIDKSKDRTDKGPVEALRESQIYHYGSTERYFTCNLSSDHSLFLSS